jgi:FHS family glucose/mannose:H+ symporter-like MFS transporter
MNKGRWAITLGAFISMGFLGMSRSFLGTALPAIRSSLDLTFLEAGTFAALLQLGFASAVFVGGPISDVFKKNIILMVGLLVLGTNLIFFGLSQWFWISLSVIALIGIGGGLIEASSNPLLVQLYPGRGSTLMNLHHFFFAIGSLAGPLIMGAVLTRSMPWQWAYMGFGFFVLLILLFLLSQRISSPETGTELEMKVMGKLMGQRTFLSLFLVMFFGNGVQSGIIYWLVTFLEETRGFSISLASISLSLFLLCMAMGRLISSYLLTRINDVVYLVILFSMLLFFMAVSLYGPGKWVIPLFGICGLAMSGVFPTLMGMAGRIYSETPGTAMGLIATGAGLGSMAIPWLMSLISQLTNLRLGFLSFEIYLVAALILICINFKKLRLASVVNPALL